MENMKVYYWRESENLADFVVVHARSLEQALNKVKSLDIEVYNQIKDKKPYIYDNKVFAFIHYGN